MSDWKRLGGTATAWPAAIGIGSRSATDQIAAVLPVVKPSTSAMRGVGRYSNLIPADDGLIAFAEWLLQLGETVEEEYFIPHYDDVCEIAGWDAPADEPAPAVAIPDPPQPLATVTLPDAAPTVGLKRARKPMDAATGFVKWARENGHCGTYDNDQFRALYLRHCREVGVTPTPENMLRKVLKTIIGAPKQAYGHHPGPGRKADLRYRPRLWTISAPATVSEVPWTELPMRKAA